MSWDSVFGPCNGHDPFMLQQHANLQKVNTNYPVLDICLQALPLCGIPDHGIGYRVDA